jgi:hypothetical protein
MEVYYGWVQNCTVTILEIEFVHFTTCCTLLEILAAFSSFERLKFAGIALAIFLPLPPSCISTG